MKTKWKVKHTLRTVVTFQTSEGQFQTGLNDRRRQRSRVVCASDSQSSSPGCESRSDHYLVSVHHSPEFKSSATLVNSRLVYLRPVGIKFHNDQTKKILKVIRI